MKRTLVLSLGLLIIGVGANLWLFNGQEIVKSKPELELESRQKLKVKGQKQLARDFNTDDLYEGEKVNRETPFLTGRQEQAKFNYSQRKKGKEKARNQPEERETLGEEASRQAKEIKPASLNFYLRGIVKNEGQKLIIVANQEESYILEKGEVINDYQVIEIDGDTVILKKDKQLYRLKSKIKIYEN